jgi:hypothetical protein
MFCVFVFSALGGTLILFASKIYSGRPDSNAYILLAGALAAIGIVLLIDLIHLQLRWIMYELNPSRVRRDFYVEAGKARPRREPLLVKYSPTRFLSHVLYFEEVIKWLTELIYFGIYGKVGKGKDQENDDAKRVAIEEVYGFNSRLP